MHVFETLPLGATLLSGVTRRFGAPYPTVRALRSAGTVGNGAYRQVAEELDQLELTAARAYDGA